MVAIAFSSGAEADDSIDHLDALHRLARHRTASVPLAAVPELLGMTADEAAEVIARWVDAGAVELWPDRPSGPALVLSSATGARLGLVLLDVPGHGLKWAPKGKPVPKPRDRRKGPRVMNETDLSEPDSAGLFTTMVDPHTLDPARALDRRRGDMPTVLIGLRVAWPVAPDAMKRCGVCGAVERLSPGTVCLWCNRVGAEPPTTATVKLATVKTAEVKGSPTTPKGAEIAPKGKVDVSDRTASASGFDATP